MIHSSNLGHSATGKGRPNSQKGDDGKYRKLHRCDVVGCNESVEDGCYFNNGMGICDSCAGKYGHEDSEMPQVVPPQGFKS